MSVANYVKSLLPSFEASRVKDNLENLSNEIDQFTLPTAENLRVTFGPDWKWRDKNAEILNKAITQDFNKSKLRNANMLEIIAQCLTNMQTTLPFLLMESDKAFGRTIAVEGITFDRAAILQLSEVADYFVTYTRKLLNYLSAAELAELEGSRIKHSVNTMDIEYLLANRYTYINAMNIVAIDMKEIKGGLSKIPVAIVDPENEADMRVVVGTSQMDPFGFASLPFPLSIVFKIASTINDFQIARYDAAQEEANTQQYRCIILKERIENGRGDAAVEKQLAESEDRLTLARRKIAKLEEKYGVNKQA